MIESIVRKELKTVEDFLGTPKLAEYLEELLSSSSLIKETETAVKDESFFKKKRFENIFEFGLYRIALYCLTRSLKPKSFLETGVLHGLTSNFILEAMLRNTEGKLISVDYPSYFHDGPKNEDGFIDTLPPARQPGWVIPSHKKRYWKIHLGKSSSVLPTLDIDSLDVFLHDSDHTSENMTFEFEWAWSKLRKDGILISDNITVNTAFDSFSKKVNRQYIVLGDGIHFEKSSSRPRFGIMRK